MKKEIFLLGIACNLLISLLFCCVTYGQAGIIDVTSERRLVEHHPDNLKAHQNYIDKCGTRNPLLVKQYQQWMKEFPKSAIVPFAIGKAFQEVDDKRCVFYLSKAVSLNPQLADGWAALAYYMFNMEDHQSAIELMQRAVKASPQNPEFLFRLAVFNQKLDPPKFDSLMIELVHRFPEHENSIKGLYYLATDPYNEKEKAAYFEAIFTLGHQQQSPWFWTGMKYYYDFLINNDEQKAFELALKMVVVVKKNRLQWKQKLNIARKFIEAKALIENNNAEKALVLLTQINLGNSISMGIQIDAEEMLVLYKAKAADANYQTKMAYDSLSLFYSKQPSDRISERLYSYANKLGIDSNTVNDYIWKLRDSAAWKETDFTLERYTDHKKISLSDYKGKVVLLTFWYPSCGPCREEFPHFESVVKKINSNNLVYIAINDDNLQEDRVLPLIKAKGYTFVPLRDSPNKAKGNLPDVSSAPTNYLIDQKGRVIFSNFQINDNNERMLELMISELLRSSPEHMTNP